MARPRSNLSLLSRANPSGVRYWYAVYRDPETDKKTFRSTGIEDDGKEGSKRRAEAFAHEALKEAASLPPGQSMTFKELAEDFWAWGKSQYLEARLARDPKALSPEHAKTQNSYLNKHVRPYLDSMRFIDITPDVLDKLVTRLLKDGKSTQTVKHVVHAMTPVFDLAIRRRAIKYNPIKSMMPFAVRSKERDAFEADEAKALLNPATVSRVWGDDWKAYSIAVLCAVTGARFGSVVALTRSDIVAREWNGTKYYEVNMRNSFAAIRGKKEGSKTGRGASVPVATDIMEIILPRLGADGQLFTSVEKHGILSHKKAIRSLHLAMAAVGITDEQQAARLLGFHAFRHAFVTRAKALGVAENVRAAFTEHKDEKTTDRYSHLRAVDLLEALPVQLALFA